MSIDPTGRGARGPAVRTGSTSPPSPKTPDTSPSVAAMARQFDERLGLRSGAGASARQQSVSERPRVSLPAAPRAGTPAAGPSRRSEPPAEQLERLKTALVAYYEEDQAAPPGRTAESARVLAEPAFRQAEELLQLLDGLKGPLKAKAVADRVPGFAYQMRVSAAYQLACALPKNQALVSGIEQGMRLGLPLELLGPLLLEGIALADHKAAEAQRCLPPLRAAVEKYGTAKGAEEPGALTCLQQAVTGLAEALHGQLRAAEMRMTFTMLHLAGLGAADGEFAVAIAPFKQFTEERLADLGRICDLHEDARVPLRAEERQWLAAHIEALRGDAEAACLAGCRLAANAVEGEESAVAELLLEFADSFRTMLSSLEEMRDLPRLPAEVAERIAGETRHEVPTVRPDVVAEQREAEREAKAEVQARKEAAPGPKSASSSRTKKGQRKHAPPKAAAAPSAAAAKPISHELAQERLRTFPRAAVPPPGAPLDLVALGTSIRRDTSVLRLLNERTDPIVVADALRSAVRRWFGEPHAWERTRRQVASDASDPAARAALLAEIDQRRQAIDALMARIATQELDQVKGHARPEESHVQLLYAAGELEVRPGLRVLPSEGDPDAAHGKVFELALQPKPTSGGELPPPIYLHLHTDKPVTAEACRKLPLSQLSAAHFKSAAQSGHGATWERLNNALGQVHRGHVKSPALLKDLLRRGA
jgi:hypothetical protein